MQSELKQCAYLQDAGQDCARLLYEEFQDCLVLARVFVTIPFLHLPVRDKQFVTEFAGAKGILPLLYPKTRVLSLLGTYSDRPEWNDRYHSQGHLGIPLVTASFTESIPMIARLMSDMGVGEKWYQDEDASIQTTRLEQIAGVFYVKDAPTWLDHRNRKIVSEQDFVAAHGIKTVFGLGGSYLDGSFVTIILFARETITQAQVEGFMPLVISFKIATMNLVTQARYFHPTLTPVG